LDEAFGLAIGARSVWAGKEMSQAVARTSGAEELGTITRAVIAHEALGLDAEGSEESQGTLKEENRAVLAFIGHDLSKGQAGSVIDANVDEFPTGAAHLIAPIPGDPVTGAHNFAQLFDIEVKQLAWELALVTHHRRSRRQVAQPGQAMAAQEARNRRARKPALARDLEARQAQPAQSQDDGHLGDRRLPRRTLRPRGTIP